MKIECYRFLVLEHSVKPFLAPTQKSNKFTLGLAAK